MPRQLGRGTVDTTGMPVSDLAALIQQLTEQMHSAAENLQFEVAARIRDEVGTLKKELRGLADAHATGGKAPVASRRKS